ncbi:MAG: hypothetical protein KAG64_08440 [Bacteroidales bacterium]|nr:hypothetical protein [Bacteroidales bacterium]
MSFRLINILILVLLLLLNFNSIAQKSDAPTITLDSLEMGFEVDLQSASAVNNALLNASGFIDQDLKDENLARLGNTNQGGTFVNTKLFYKSNRGNLWGVKRLSYYFALEWKSLNEYQFTKDLYQLVFYGNNAFEGEAAYLTHSGMMRVDYFQIKTGLHRSTKNLRHVFGLNLALNLGNKLSGFRFYDPSYLFTNPTGTAVVLQSNVDYFESDTAKSEWYNVSGVGASIDFNYKFIEKESYSLLVSIENIGFIKWNKNTLRLSEDKKHVFQGIEVDNIFQMPSPLVNSEDTLKDYIYANTTQGANYLITPIDVKMQFEQYFFHQRIKMGMLTHFRLLSYMLPIFQMDASYKVSDNFQLGPVLSYGGYTAFNAGLKMQFDYKGFQLKLESRYLTGFAKHTFSGMGGFITFTYKIYKK